MTEYIYLLEHEDISGDSDQAQHELEEQARVILDDRKRQLGRFRLDSELTCPECVSNRRPAKMIAQTYISAGGAAWLLVPARLGSAGMDGTRTGRSKYPAIAGLLDGTAGPVMTQCKNCRTYFFILSKVASDRPVLLVHRLIESIYGAISETGAPSVTHKLAVPET